MKTRHPQLRVERLLNKPFRSAITDKGLLLEIDPIPHQLLFECDNILVETDSELTVIKSQENVSNQDYFAVVFASEKFVKLELSTIPEYIRLIRNYPYTTCRNICIQNTPSLPES